jgi:hypothetical protein
VFDPEVTQDAAAFVPDFLADVLSRWRDLAESAFDVAAR